MLAVELGRREVSIQEFRRYCIAWAVLISALAVGFFSEPKGSLTFDLVGIIEIGVVAVTVVICYFLNCSERPAKFLAMMICLAWPEAVKAILVGSAFFLLLNPSWYPGSPKEPLLLALDIIGWVVLLAVCVRLVVFVRFIASERNTAGAVSRQTV